MSNFYSHGDDIYSVDMMIAGVNLFKPPYGIYQMEDFQDKLKLNVWGDPIDPSKEYSPEDVLFHQELYPEEVKRIDDADVNIPILIDPHFNIIDGFHRLAKLYEQGSEKVRAITIPWSVMDLTLLRDDGDWKKIDEEIKSYTLIELFVRRFMSDQLSTGKQPVYTFAVRQ